MLVPVSILKHQKFNLIKYFVIMEHYKINSYFLCGTEGTIGSLALAETEIKNFFLNNN